MDDLIREYYGKNEVREVIYLPEADLLWEEASAKAPKLPRGWYELCMLDCKDRIEFSRDFWLTSLPFVPKAHSKLDAFFDRLEDVGVFLLEKKEGSSVECVYSLKEGRGFFRADPPCSRESIDEAKRLPFPRDFLAFLKIHNGFSKAYDRGILPVEQILSLKKELESFLLETDKKVTCDGLSVDPCSLIPFYESVGRSSYQCFYSDWYPAAETGNVCFSLGDYTISRYMLGASEETLAFPHFLDWLVFYLEGWEG